MAGIKVEQARRESAALNERFRSRQLLDSRFYHQLESRGCEVDRCVLVDLIPDGSDTYFGTLIRQDGRVFRFDLALAMPSASEWEDCTGDFLDQYERRRKTRPWEPDVIAYEAFLQERKSAGQTST